MYMYYLYVCLIMTSLTVIFSPSPVALLLLIVIIGKSPGLRWNSINSLLPGQYWCSLSCGNV